MIIVEFMYSLASGGAERFVVDLSNELSKVDNEVHLITLRSNSLAEEKLDCEFYKNSISEKIIYHNLALKRGFSALKMWKVCKLLKRINPDVIHCHLNVLPYIYPLAVFSRKFAIVHTLHSLAQHASGGRIQRRIDRILYKSGRVRAVTISKICQESYNALYRLNNSMQIDNGRSPIAATPKFEIVKQEIKNLKGNDNATVFLHVARFHPAKNQKRLIEAFNLLYNNKVNFVLLIIGASFNTEDGENLQRQSCPSIHFLGEKDNVEDYILNSDAFCLSSDYEGLPISLLEAMSVGCIPICTPAGGIPDVIINGKTGFLSNGFTFNDYFDAIMNYLHNKEYINISDIKNYFERNFSIKICASSYERLFLNYNR